MSSVSRVGPEGSNRGSNACRMLALGETGRYALWLVTRHVAPGQRRRIRIEYDVFALLDRYAEGVGFEPTEARRTSTAFEAVPFVRSGILPGRHASGPARSAGGRRRTRAAGPPHSSAPHARPVTGGAVVEAGVGGGCRRGCRRRPAFGSVAPKTRRPTRALTMAPAHIAHGSSVTTSVQSSSRQWPTTAAASRRARISAWAVGSPVSSRSLWRAAIDFAVAQRRRRRSGRRRGRAPAAASARRRVHRRRRRRSSASTAEGVGFEPTVGCPTHAFQACRFGRSRIPPGSALRVPARALALAASPIGER